MGALQLREDSDGALLQVRVKPRAHKDAIEGIQDGLLLVSVRAAPADGEANAAVQVQLAQAMRCAKGSVQLVRGQKSRVKVFRLSGFKPKEVLNRLGLT